MEFKPTRITDHVGGYGLIAEWNSGVKGPTIMVRAAMDAPGDGHYTGNDGHMALVAGLAKMLHESRPTAGSVALLFQPSSSVGEGARSVYLDDKFRPYKPDLIIGFQSVPDVPLGTIIFKEGQMTTASKGLTIKLHGKSTGIHTKERSIHPLGGVIRLSEQILDLESSEKYEEYVQTNIAHIRMGDQVFHSSPDYAEISATIRAKKRRELDKLAKRIVDQAQIAGQIHDLGVDVTWHDSFEAVKNPEESGRFIGKWCSDCDLILQKPEHPFRWSDDFSVYQKDLNSVYFGLGSGLSSAPLGTEEYIFPDDLLETGIHALWNLIQLSIQRLNK